MKHTLKKSLAIILAAATILCCAPLSGIADLDLPEFGGFKKLANSVSDFFDGFATKAEAAIHSGKCGDNLTWTLDRSTGVLSIDGTGDMYDYEGYRNEAPWADYDHNVHSLIIGENVTSIGAYAFYDCEINSTITISKNINKIGERAFTSNPIESFSVSPNNLVYSSDSSGVLYNKDKTVLIQYPIANSRTSFSVPNGVITIESYSFGDGWHSSDGEIYGEELIENITISNTVKTIKPHAFISCQRLKNVSLGNSLISIGENAFNECTALSKISIPDSVEIVGDGAFSYCDNLSEVTIGKGAQKNEDGDDLELHQIFRGCSINSYDVSSKHPYLYSLDGVVFSKKGENNELIAYPLGNSRLSYDIPEGTTDIGYEAFSGYYFDIENCYLKKIKLPSTIDYLCYSSFRYLNHLEEIAVDNSHPKLLSENGVLFSKDKTYLHLYPRNKSGNKYHIPNSVIHISSTAFQNASNLFEISIPESVTSVSASTFYKCGYYNNVNNWQNGSLYIDSWLIDVKEGTTGSFVIKEGTVYVADNAFETNNSITQVTIPSTLKNIGYGNSFGNVDTLYFNSKNYDGENFEGTYYWKSLTTVYIGNTVESLGIMFESLFINCKNLQNVVFLPTDNFKKISLEHFLYCDKLDSLILPNTTEEIHINISAINSCDSLQFIHIPPNAEITQWGYNGEDKTPNTNMYFCSNSTDCKAKKKLEDLGYVFKVCDGSHSAPGGETPPAEDAYETQSIKVMSYNVYVKDDTVKGITNGKTYDCSYETRTRYIVQSINENMPDSIGLQELTSEMRTFLENFEDLNGGILAANYTGVGDYRSKSGNNNEASLIFYNKNKFTLESSGTFWLSESGEKYSKHTASDYPRICTYALLENKTTGLQYLHVNTHLEHDHSSDEGGSNDAAIFSSEKIIDFVNKNFPNIPVVITGDFNQKKGSAPYNNFINAGYTDTRDVYSGNLNTYINSYNQGEDKKAYGAKVIDHVLVNEYFNNGIESYTVYNEDYSNSDKYGNLALDYPYPSDHHPIVVELKATYSGDIVSSKEIKFGENKSVEVVLDDDWFEKSNTEYNHELAQFCADYVMMGYCYNDDTVKGYLSQMGFDTVDSCMNAGRDEVNYFIASKDITVNGETETLVFAGFIGSYKKQWYSNFDPYGTERDNWKKRNAPYSDSNEKGKVHLGFADAREYVYARLKEFIANIDKENMKLLLSGHSRGAATANLLAAKLIDETYVNSSTATVNRNNLYTYTFATPNVASTQKNVFDSKYKCIFNIVNPEDFVTKVLPNSWGYYRYGKTYVLPSQTNDKNWKSYLKAMNKCFAQYKFGEIYDPYNDGEKTTYKIVEKFTKNINNLDEFYEKDIWAYNISGMIPQFMKPYDFFKDSLLGYLSEQNKAGGLNLAVAILLYGKTVYQDMIAYFFNPDLLLDASLNPGVDPGGKFKQAHQMETYAAYMNALTESQIKQTKLYYENTVNCPVDIEVYDNATNELVGKITNNVIDETVAAKENAIVMDVEGDSKSFWLPSNGDFRVVLTGNDDGTMDYTVSNIDSDTGETERLNFFDVEIENGVSMEGEVNADEFVLDEYTLTHEEDGIIKPTEILVDEDLKDISISVTTEGIGYTDGNITVTSGDYVTITATANEGNSFIGWYENGTLVSTDVEYSFVAKGSRNLIAKFTNNYSIQWNVDGEITETYSEVGKTVVAPGNPVKEGYKFVGWTPAIPNVMPAENLTFTAVWDLLFTAEIRNPSTTTISYGDSIILHADINDELPTGYTVEWTASNGNFSYKADGATCTISPAKSGDTTFTATIYDADGNPVSTDEQTMTAKAGFFDKIIAFFKKLFGLTKTYPDIFGI